MSERTRHQGECQRCPAARDESPGLLGEAADPPDGQGKEEGRTDSRTADGVGNGRVEGWGGQEGELVDNSQPEPAKRGMINELRINPAEASQIAGEHSPRQLDPLSDVKRLIQCQAWPLPATWSIACGVEGEAGQQEHRQRQQGNKTSRVGDRGGLGGIHGAAESTGGRALIRGDATLWKDTKPARGAAS